MRGDAAESQDADRRCGGARQVEKIEAAAFADERFDWIWGLGIEGNFLEDRSEQNEGWGRVACVSHVGKAMAGDADDRVREIGRGIQGSDVGGGKGALRGGKVHPVCSCGDGDVGAGVDEQPGLGRVGAKDCEQFAGEVDQRGRFQVLFAELEEVDIIRNEVCGLPKESGVAGGFVSREAGSIGDGIAEHYAV